jgi:hypothetical protein
LRRNRAEWKSNGLRFTLRVISLAYLDLG